MRVAVLFLFLTALLPARAHQPKDGDIHATFGAFTYTTQTWHHDWESPVLIGPGMSVEADIDQNGGLEISMFYLRNPFSIKSEQRVYTEMVKRMYITTGYRHWFTNSFSAALAFSSSYAMGNYKVVQDDFGGLDHPGTSATDITEYGFEASLVYEFWRSGLFSTVIDSRYSYNVTAKKGEDANHYGVMLGLKYFLQSRQGER